VSQFVDEGDHETAVGSQLLEVRELSHAQVDSRGDAAVLLDRCEAANEVKRKRKAGMRPSSSNTPLERAGRKRTIFVCEYTSS
jgi:hypothetical protein